MTMTRAKNETLVELLVAPTPNAADRFYPIISLSSHLKRSRKGYGHESDSNILRSSIQYLPLIIFSSCLIPPKRPTPL